MALRQAEHAVAGAEAEFRIVGALILLTVDDIPSDGTDAS